MRILLVEDHTELSHWLAKALRDAHLEQLETRSDPARHPEQWLVATAYLAVPVMDKLTLRWFARDLDMRGNLVANALSDSVSESLQYARTRRIELLFQRALQDESQVAIGWCSVRQQRRPRMFAPGFHRQAMFCSGGTRGSPRDIRPC